MVLSSFHPIWGGTENQALLQARELVRRSHEVTVVTWRHNTRLPAQEVIDGVTVHRVSKPQAGPRAAAIGGVTMSAALARTIPASDVVSAHQAVAPAYIAALIAWRARKPIVAKIAASPETPGEELNQLRTPGLEGAMRRSAIRFLSRHAVAIAMTDEIETGLRGLGFRRIVRIPNAVQSVASQDRKELRRKLLPPLGIPLNAKLAVASGRFDRVKGFDRLIRAWACSSDGNQAFLLLVGRGPEGAVLQELTEELAISERARFVSPSSDAREYLAVADVVVIPSLSEGMSNVLLEAMAAAVPVVSTPVSGSVDLIRDGYSGRIVPHEDPQALISAIEDLLDNPGDIGERGREAVLARCRIGHVVDLYERLFANLSHLPAGVITTEQLQRLPIRS